MSDNQVKIDYLTDDAIIKNQQWVCLSFLSPEGISNCKIRGLKIRGVYETEEEANKRACELRDIDKYFHVFVGEVGKWLPWDPEPNSESVKEENYAEEPLQNLMKSYMESQSDAKKFEQQRKQDLIEKNIEQSLETRKDNKKEIVAELDNFKNKKLSQEDRVLEQNLEKTLNNIDEEIAKLEDRTKKTNIEKKQILKNFEAIKIDDEEIEKTTNELEESKALYNKLVNNSK
jgi:DNA repair exonuclease SbcCD ATPase subunit